eukprot:1167467-Prorocentrum_minimum.AAC.1
MSRRPKGSRWSLSGEAVRNMCIIASCSAGVAVARGSGLQSWNGSGTSSTPLPAFGSYVSRNSSAHLKRTVGCSHWSAVRGAGSESVSQQEQQRAPEAVSGVQSGVQSVNQQWGAVSGVQTVLTDGQTDRLTHCLTDCTPLHPTAPH